MNILIIEDNVRLCDTLTDLFQKEGITATCKYSLKDGYEAFLSDHYAVILLDRMLPDGDGITLVSKLRKEHYEIPILILTALSEVDDKVLGIEEGADDYMIKPFEFKELLARVKMLTKRSHIVKAEEELSFADLTYHPDSHTIYANGKSTILSKKEHELFWLLLSKPNQVFSREEMIDKIWGQYLAIENGNLDNQIYFVRKQLAIVKSRVTIKVSRGVGYYLSDE